MSIRLLYVAFALVLMSSCIHKREKPSLSFWHKAAALVASSDSVFEELQSPGAFKFDHYIGKRIFLKKRSKSVIGDIYFAKTQNPSPLVIFSHGNKSFK